MKAVKKLFKCIISLLLMLSVISLQPVTTVYADEDTTLGPVSTKTLVSNGNGTYSLSLSVTGAASSVTETSKANVLIVLDLSNSMSETQNSLAEHATGRYGYVDNERVNLYRRQGNSYQQITNNSYSGTVYTREWVWDWFDSGYVYTEYTGTRYAYVTQSRLEVAKSAINSLVNSLSQNNTAESPDNIEISFLTFGTLAYTNPSNSATGTYGQLRPYDANYGTWYNGTDMSSLTNRVSSLNVPGNNSGGTNWDDALYHAKLVANAKNDGDPTHIIFVSDGNPTAYMNQNHTQYTYNENSNNTYNNARNEVQNGINDNDDISFYGVGAFGNVSRMQNLSTAAGGSYYSATDSEALNRAFADIINSITNATNFQNVKFTDGITAGTSATVLDLGADVTDFRYTITGNGNTYTIVLDENGNIDTINGSKQPVTLTDSVGNSYTLSIGASFPAATPNDDTSSVEWDLSPIGRLLHNYTYTVTFDVWPSQEAYDTVAALNNGAIAWESESVDKNSYVRTDNGNGTYSYSLKTNSGAQVDYTSVETTNGEVTSQTNGTTKIETFPTISLTSDTMTARKEWDGDLPGNNASVTLELYIDGVASGVRKVLSNATNWEASFAIAPGLQVGDEIKEPGHKYTLVETAVVGVDEWDYVFDSNTEHPMIVNGILTFTANDNILLATNHKKSSMTITKNVTNKTNFPLNANQLFDFEVTISGLGNNRLDAYVASTAGVVTESRTSNLTINESGHYTISADGKYTIQLKADEYIYIDGLVKDVTVTAREVNLPSGYTLTTVSSNGEGPVISSDYSVTTKADWNKNYQVTFGNTYDVAEVYLSFTKSVVGNDAIEKFDIALKDGSRNIIETVTIDQLANGTSSTKQFSTLTFDKEGTYNYYIQETTTTNVAGWTYDNNEHLVQITVTKDGNNKLVANVTGDNPTITNTYDYVPNSARVSVTKVLDQVQSGLELPNIEGKYTFTLYDSNNVKVGDSVTNPSANGGTVQFAPIQFSTVGTYTYYVVETGNVDNVTNDQESRKTVTFNVTQGADNSLKVDDQSVTFTNTYTYSEVFAELAVKKVLSVQSGNNAPDITGKYTFTLSALTANAPMPAVTTATNDASGAVNFGEVKFTSEGTYIYEVTESGTVTGVENDPISTKQITVEVKKNSSGVLEVVSQNEVTFTNTYKVEPITVDVPFVKNIVIPNGLEGTTPDTNGKFTFTITSNTANAPMPLTTSLVNGNSGVEQKFEGITFTAPGTYSYTITETGELDYITNDPNHAKTFEIVVTDDGEGKLVASVNAGQTITFNNTYTSSNVEFTFGGTKEVIVKNLADDEGDGNLEGDDNSIVEPGEDGNDDESNTSDESTTESDSENEDDENNDESGLLGAIINSIFTPVYAAPETINLDIAEGQFTFEIFYRDGTTTGVIGQTKASSGQYAEIEFGTLSYSYTDLLNLVYNGKATRDADGTYHINYLIREVNVPSGYTAGTTVQNVSVAIHNNGVGGWDTSVVYENNQNGVEFTNYYNTNEVDIDIIATKTLTGRTLRDGEFTFTISGDGPLPTNTTVTNSANGSIDFGVIKFQRSDLGNASEKTFTYTITENQGSINNVTYDTEVKTMTITVTDDGAGHLSAVVSEAPIIFTNTFEDTVIKNITVSKTLDGNTPEAEAFLFHLLDSEGELIGYATNDENGNVIFSGLTYDQDDVGSTFTYTIREFVPNVKNYIYDLNPITVTVEVVLDANDNVDTIITYSRESFKNESKNVIIIDPPVTKVITGDTPETDEVFEFKLTGSEGTELTTQIVGEGTEEFGEIELTEAGTYTFTIEEVVGDAEGYTYDSEVYTKTVIVSEDDAGRLSATEFITKADGTEVEEAIFTNTYTKKKPPVPDTSDDKPKTPDTSDSTNVGAWAGLFGSILVILGAVSILFIDKKRRKA